MHLTLLTMLPVASLGSLVQAQTPGAQNKSASSASATVTSCEAVPMLRNLRGATAGTDANKTASNTAGEMHKVTGGTEVPNAEAAAAAALQETKSKGRSISANAESAMQASLEQTNSTDGAQAALGGKPPGKGGNPGKGATSKTAAGAVTETRSALYDELLRAGHAVACGLVFATGSDQLLLESMSTLKQIASMLEQHPELWVRIEGHTDDAGGKPGNQVLSERRAASVKTALVAQFKVDGRRLDSKGFGATRPADTNTTPEGRANNRRIELVKM